VGRPNAGKSTLANALAGRPAAVADAAPGVTRDAVDVRFDVGGRLVALADTAGVRRIARGRGIKGADALEEAAAKATARVVERGCDACLFCVDASKPVTRDDLGLARDLVAGGAEDAPRRAPRRPIQVDSGTPVVVAATKADAAEATAAEIEESLRESQLGFLCQATHAGAGVPAPRAVLELRVKARRWDPR